VAVPVGDSTAPAAVPGAGLPDNTASGRSSVLSVSVGEAASAVGLIGSVVGVPVATPLSASDVVVAAGGDGEGDPEEDGSEDKVVVVGVNKAEGEDDVGELDGFKEVVVVRLLLAPSLPERETVQFLTTTTASCPSSEIIGVNETEHASFMAPIEVLLVRDVSTIIGSVMIPSWRRTFVSTRARGTVGKAFVEPARSRMICSRRRTLRCGVGNIRRGMCIRGLKGMIKEACSGAFCKAPKR